MNTTSSLQNFYITTIGNWEFVENEGVVNENVILSKTSRGLSGRKKNITSIFLAMNYTYNKMINIYTYM